MDSFWSNSNSNSRDGYHGWSSSPKKTALSPEINGAQTAILPQDNAIAYYMTKANLLEQKVAVLERTVEFLTDSLHEARRQHDLDYQLYLLRGGEKTPTPRLEPPPRGLGYEAVAQKVNSTFQRRAWAGPKRKTPVMLEDPDDPIDDPELEATLRRLLDESKNASK